MYIYKMYSIFTVHVSIRYLVSRIQLFFLFVGVVDSTHCVCANAFGAYRNTFQLYRGWSNIAHLCWLTAVLLAPSSSLSAADLSGRQRSLSIYRHITDIAIYPIPSLFSQWQLQQQQKTAAHLNSNRRLSLFLFSLFFFFLAFSLAEDFALMLLWSSAAAIRVSCPIFLFKAVSQEPPLSSYLLSLLSCSRHILYIFTRCKRMKREKKNRIRKKG